MRLTLFFCFFATTCPPFAAELEFKEAFADPAQRTAALEKLVPGSRDWFFYRALNQQLSGDEVAFKKTMAEWKAASDDPRRGVPIDSWGVLDNRRILLSYQAHPEASVEELIRKFDLHFNDTQPEAEAGASLADHFDPEAIAEAAFQAEAAKSNPAEPWKFYSRDAKMAELANLQTFSEAKALDFYHSLGDARDPRVIDLLRKVYSGPHAPDFGSAPVDGLLTHAQLDALGKSTPKLRVSQEFALAWMTTLPTREGASELDPITLTAHLAHCRDFILNAPPALNSLKANVLYYHLKMQREAGNYPLEDFLAYLRLPRGSHPLLLPGKDQAHEIDPHVAGFQDATACGEIGDDSELVPALLDHFLATSETPGPFDGLIKPDALANLQARAHLLAGDDPAKWSAALKPAEVQALQQETRVGFAPRRPGILDSEGPAEIALELKNTPKLLVRVFEIDLPRLAQQNRLSALSVSMDIDGLLPQFEKRFTYDQPPMLVHGETIALPEISGPGAWLVECVSGNATCRTLVRKGRLMPVVEGTAAGVAIRVFNESGALQEDAAAFLGVQRFPAGADGIIRIADTGHSAPGYVQVGKQVALTGPLDLESDLKLAADFHLDREQLLPNTPAHLLLEPHLRNHGRDLPLERLGKIRLVMHLTTAGGGQVERMLIQDGKLEPAMPVSFQIPERTTAVSMILSGEAVSEGEDRARTLETYANWAIGGGRAEAEDPVASAFFSRDANGYFVEVRGKNGELFPARPLTLNLNRHGYQTSLRLDLKTGVNGRIALGALDGIDQVTANAANLAGASLDVNGVRDLVSLPPKIHATTDEEIRLPRRQDLQPESSAVSLFQTGLHERITADFTSSLQSDGRQWLLHGLPEGRYKLTLGEDQVALEILAAPERDGYMIRPGVAWQHYTPELPVISAAAVEQDALVVRLQRPSKDTRVQVITHRFLRDWDPSGGSTSPNTNEPQDAVNFSPQPCEYLLDRQLSDESRYILERRGAAKFPGTLLPRPGLLLNRWTEEVFGQVLQGGAEGTAGKRAVPASPSPEPHITSGRNGAGYGTGGSGPDFPFLAKTSTALYQLQPGPDGIVRVPLKDLGDGQVVEIIASSADGSYCTRVPLPPSQPALRDLRLTQPLDATKHYVASRSLSVLPAGQEAEIHGVLDSDWRAFSTLTDVFQLLDAKVDAPEIARFRPLLAWDKLGEAEKLEFLATHSCHEVHLFLARKDRPFFEKYVKPRLLEKREPTVIDDILTGRELQGYLQPASWARLNAMEKALLAQALPPARSRISHELELRWQVEAPSPEEQDGLFNSVLTGKPDTSVPPPVAQNAQEVSGVPSLLEKLKRIIIPAIEFDDTSVEEAIDFLRLRSKELDTSELDPGRRGINFVIRRPRTGASEATPEDGGGLAAAGDPGALRIKELRLRNVPLAEALRYICDATRLRYKVDDFAVTLVAATETNEDLFSRTFSIRRDFLERIGGHRPQRIIDVLKEKGIAFPEGASATLTGKSLVVRNAPTNIDLIEQLVEEANQEDEDGYSNREETGAGAADPFAPSPEGGDPFAPTLEGAGPAALKMRPYGRQASGSTDDAGPGREEGLAPWEAERDTTRIWREQNYYTHRGETGEPFIGLNAFWLDLAKWDGQGQFLSPHFAECATHVNEALLCLAMLDLPFTAEPPQSRVDGAALKIKSTAPMLLFYRETREAAAPEADAPVLVRQTFHRLNERFRQENGLQVENTVAGDFVAGTPYEMSLVVTNPSGVSRRAELLAQIPAGAIPLQNRPATLSASRNVKPYGVLTETLPFYFPTVGTFPVYPLHVSENGQPLAATAPHTISVVAKAAAVSDGSWTELARSGTNDQVLARMREMPLQSNSLFPIRWRLHDRAFFDSAMQILRERMFDDPQVSSYAFFHRDPAAMRFALENGRSSTDPARMMPLGIWLDSPLLDIRPEPGAENETLEFDPLINPRSHRFAAFPRLSNPQAQQAYEKLLDRLAWKPAPDDDDRLAICVALLMQDRTEEALARFDKIDAAKLRTHLQYDYVHAVTGFLRGKPEEAKAIAQGHLDGPQELWVKRFKEVIAQADEVAGLARGEAAQEKDAEKPVEPSLQLASDSDGRLVIASQRLERTELQFYQVDLEMLFSKNPFLSTESNDLPETLPNEVQQVALDASGKTTVEMPARFRDGNVLVSATSGNSKALRILDSPALTVTRQTAERTLQVTDTATHKPLPETYVKVYALDENGQAVFHKDGYTDLRGKFDYLTHTGMDVSNIHRLAILTLHPEKGARVEIIEL